MFRNTVNENPTIDQVDLAKLTPSLEYKSEFFHEEIFVCIRKAIEQKDFNALKNIVDQVTPVNTISTDRVIDIIYFTAIARKYSSDDFEKLLSTIPIDINRPIARCDQGFCQPPTIKISSLLYIAASFINEEIFNLLLKKGVDVNQKSEKNETPEEYLRRSLAADEPYMDYGRQNRVRMLNSLEALKEPEQRRYFRF